MRQTVKYVLWRTAWVGARTHFNFSTVRFCWCACILLCLSWCGTLSTVFCKTKQKAKTLLKCFKQENGRLTDFFCNMLIHLMSFQKKTLIITFHTSMFSGRIIRMKTMLVRSHSNINLTKSNNKKGNVFGRSFFVVIVILDNRSYTVGKPVHFSFKMESHL